MVLKIAMLNNLTYLIEICIWFLENIAFATIVTPFPWYSGNYNGVMNVPAYNTDNILAHW